LQSIFSIQVLRALAAISVVIAHIQTDVTQRAGLIGALPNLEWCKAGVDVFFVVSGFIMVYSSEPLFAKSDGPRIFFKRRVVRIVPLYWLVTSIYIAIAALVPMLQHKSYSWSMVLASYLFLPARNPDGALEPVVGQGWTLNYEMFFYIVFALSVIASRRVAVSLVALVLISTVWAGKHFAPTQTVLYYWSNEIIIEFVFGILLGAIYQEGVRLSRSVRTLLLGAGLLLWYVAFAHPDIAWNHRSASWGVPAAMVVAGAVFGMPTGPSAGWQWLKKIGDASYALYLTHSLPIRGLREVWIWFGLDVRNAPWFYLFVALASAIGPAIVVHLYVERPIGRWVNAAIAHRSKKLSLSTKATVSQE
jgi:peptidoglycan/LPS O-acetylase OafA/YrhL